MPQPWGRGPRRTHTHVRCRSVGLGIRKIRSVVGFSKIRKIRFYQPCIGSSFKVSNRIAIGPSSTLFVALHRAGES